MKIFPIKQRDASACGPTSIQMVLTYFNIPAHLKKLQKFHNTKNETVIMEEHLDNTIKINLKEHYLSYEILLERPKKKIDIKLVAITKKKQSNWQPPVDHPWRKQFFCGNKLKVKQPNLTKAKV